MGLVGHPAKMSISSAAFDRIMNKGVTEFSCRGRSTRNCASKAVDSMVMFNGIEIPRPAISEFCRQHRIRRLSLFGSILCDDFGPDSDIDGSKAGPGGGRPALRATVERNVLVQGRRHEMDSNNL